jgi:predicted transcriptional regulator
MTVTKENDSLQEVTSYSHPDYPISVADSPTKTGARIAVYDDLLSAPRIIEVSPAPLPDYMEKIAANTYEQSHAQGGSLPYTVIREIAENFIHADFQECTVSIMDKGNTIRFSDQGPGILKKDQVLKPGFTSATAEMKRFIRGVGSGLPIVSEYLTATNGSIIIEDNATTGTVVTISLVSNTLSSQPFIVPTKNKNINYMATPDASLDFTKIHSEKDLSWNEIQKQQTTNQAPSFAEKNQPFLNNEPYYPSHLSDEYKPVQALQQNSPVLETKGLYHNTSYKTSFSSIAGTSADIREPYTLNKSLELKSREIDVLFLLQQKGMLGVGDITKPLDISAPTATRIFQKLEAKGMVETTNRKKRILSNAGFEYIQSLQREA